MTHTETREPFQPNGDISMRDMIHQGLATLRPLEPGTLITHDMIAEWLGEPFPRHNSYGERVYQPMDDIKEDLLRQQGVLLLPVDNTGYRVATDSEKVHYAQRRGLNRAMDALAHASHVLRATRPDRLTAAERNLRDNLETETLLAGRELRMKLRAIRKEQEKWANT